jgi:FkbM family methyltransferase
MLGLYELSVQLQNSETRTGQEGACRMLSALIHGLREGHAAAVMAADTASARRLRSDFFWSRLLRLWRLPGYNKLRQVNFGDLKVSYRFNRGDLQSLREVLIEQVYGGDTPVVPQTILDLGANIGLASLWFSKRIKSGQAKVSQGPFVLGVEPVPENAAVAEINFCQNHVPGGVVRAAVGQMSGEAWFEARAESNLGRLSSEASKGAQIRVPVVGIRDLLDRFPGGQVDLVKMDIEGGEEDLLGHDTDWLKRVKSLIVEWHDDRTDSRPLIRNIESAGFAHRRMNAHRQENLSLFYRMD